MQSVSQSVSQSGPVSLIYCYRHYAIHGHARILYVHNSKVHFYAAEIVQCPSARVLLISFHFGFFFWAF